MRKSIKWMLGLLVMGSAISALIPKNGTISPPAEAEKSDEPAPAAIEAAKKALKAEPKVKDFIYQPGQAVEWQIGVFDDGTSRVGYANYICELLTDTGAIKPSTHVRIVDIVTVSRGEDFRSASLGHVACDDRRVITP